MFGEPQLHDLAQCYPQRRVRYCWTSLPNPSELLPLQGLPNTWQDCLTPGSTVPTDELGQPITKCPTLMAARKSHSDRSRSTWVRDSNGTTRPLQIQEKERLVGMEINDTAAAQVSEASRHRMCGNAFPVAWIANLLTAFLQNHTGTLRPLASRSRTPTVCVLCSPSRIAAMLTDPAATPIIERLRTAAESDPQYQALVHHPPNHLQVRDGLLFDKPVSNCFGSYDGPAVVWVPADNALRQDLLHLVHDQAHFGTARTYAAAKRHFRWKNMHNQIQHFVARCPTCQLQKPGTASRHQPYFPETAFYPYPFHTVVLDVVEGLPLTSRGHNGVLTIVDRFTKYAIYIPIHTTWSAFRQAQCIMDSVIYQFHTPQRIHTDNGPAYRSLFKAFCSALGVQHTTGSPYHSQSQGGAERQHRTLLQTLRLTCDDRRNWDNYLQAAAHAYNDSVHAITKVSPFVAVYGCPSRLPWHLQLPIMDNADANTSICSPDRRIDTFLKQQQKIYKVILQNLQKQADSFRELRSNRTPRNFKPGDLVKVQYGLKSPTDKHKLDPYYVGPFTIAEELGKGAYRLDLPDNSPYSDRVNADRLEKWVDSDLTVFPADSRHQQHALLPPDPLVEPVHRIVRYLLRDYSLFPQDSVRYWVRTDSVSTPFMWVNETSHLLEEFLLLEETNGCIPETGITQSNYQQVKQHKEQVYLQSPAPIMVNTWTSSQLPLQVRKRPRFKPPANLLHAVVQDLFHVTDDKSEFYQGEVIRVHND